TRMMPKHIRNFSRLMKQTKCLRMRKAGRNTTHMVKIGNMLINMKMRIAAGSRSNHKVVILTAILVEEEAMRISPISFSRCLADDDRKRHLKGKIYAANYN